ncbi:MAG: N-acetyltransferase [Pseudomonadota bacterium]
MTQDFFIRPASETDLNALEALSRRTFIEAFGALYSADNLNEFLRAYHTEELYGQALADRDRILLVVERCDTLIGYCLCTPLDLPAPAPPAGSMELKRIYLDSAAQGQGIGQALLDEALGHPAMRQAPAIFISVFSGNPGAQRFYARNGFEQVAEYEFVVGTNRDREFIFARHQAEHL